MRNVVPSGLRGRLVDRQMRASRARGERAAEPIGNGEVDAPVAEIGVAILAGQAPVLVERPFDAATDRPAPARGGAAVAGCRRAGGKRDARSVDDGGRGAADSGHRGAAGDVEQRAVGGEAKPPAERGHPVDMAEIDSHRLVDRYVEDRRTESARGAGAGPVQSGSDQVGFHAKHGPINLPVITYLAAADDAGTVARPAGKAGQ